MEKFYPQELHRLAKKNKELIFIYKKSKKFSFNIMKVILLENVRKIGSIGEIIDVKEVLLEIF